MGGIMPLAGIFKLNTGGFMALYEFRMDAKGKDGLKARGLIQAANVQDLFWLIDRFGNPYQSHYRKRTDLCVCLWEGNREDYSDDATNLPKWKTFNNKRDYI
jgi:hypothetical protein